MNIDTNMFIDTDSFILSIAECRADIPGTLVHLFYLEPLKYEGFYTIKWGH